MNQIELTGLIKNIQPSHKIKDIEYDQAHLLVTRADGREDLLTLKFKKYSNKYSENDQVELLGNIRSYSEKLADGRNKVSLYVFTYFDLPEESACNHFKIDGRICKLEDIRKTKSGKHNIHFILANNLIIEETNQKLNSYLPCIAWGKTALDIAKLHVNDKVIIEGEFHSREYKKILADGELEIRVAHELAVKSFEVIYE